MFKKISQFENTFHLGKATIIIAVMTLLSRVLGFVRDLLLASQLGLSAESDIYFTAFRIPDMVYNFLILGTLSVSFIPVFSQHYLKDKAKAFLIANTIFNIASGSMVIVCVLIFIFALPLTHLIAPGFSDAQTEATANLTRLMILSPLIFTP